MSYISGHQCCVVLSLDLTPSPLSREERGSQSVYVRDAFKMTVFVHVAYVLVRSAVQCIIAHRWLAPP